MKKKRPKNIKLVQRRRVGLIISIAIIALIVLSVIGVRIWVMYYNSPEKVAQRFLDAFSIYNSAEMRMYAEPSFWDSTGQYYEDISSAFRTLAERISKEKGLPMVMLKPQIKLVIPPIEEWSLEEGPDKKVFSYDGIIRITFPESPTLPTSIVELHASFRLAVCKVQNNTWRVCEFDRSRKYRDWTVYEFLEARISAHMSALESFLSDCSDESIRDYLGGYDIMVHDPAGDSNYAWVISHIRNIKFNDDEAFVEYGLYKVSSHDPTNPVLTWKYVDVKEHLYLCNNNGMWYIKGIYFED